MVVSETYLFEIKSSKLLFNVFFNMPTSLSSKSLDLDSKVLRSIPFSSFTLCKIKKKKNSAKSDGNLDAYETLFLFLYFLQSDQCYSFFHNYKKLGTISWFLHVSRNWSCWASLISSKFIGCLLLEILPQCCDPYQMSITRDTDSMLWSFNILHYI